jgi:CheY-like chemotaxis protein
MTRARHVLIVDDDSEFRLILRDLLEDQGCSVYEAADGRAALGVLRTIQPDLIFLDLVMPIMDGWALHAELRDDPKLAEVPIAVLSAAEESRPEGVTHVLRKPVTLPSLLGLLDAVDNPKARSTNLFSGAAGSGESVPPSRTP